jgi:hypothetical protein
VSLRNNNFLPLFNKEQNFEIYNPASSGGQGKYLKYVIFPWFPLETALSILNAKLLSHEQFFEKELIKKKDIVVNTKS